MRMGTGKPDLIIGSWCGKKFRPERVAERPGFSQIPGCATPRHVRNQVVADPATRSGSFNRRPRGASKNNRGAGNSLLERAV
jgi:hypothetical protein